MEVEQRFNIPKQDPISIRLSDEDASGKSENGNLLVYSGETYYGMPPIKHSHYHWKTGLAFFFEALGGSCQLVSLVIDLAGKKEDRKLSQAGRYLALTGAFASPALLISELHNPKRWFNMLRIFRSTSPMSIGNMSLTAFGIFSGLTAAAQKGEGMGLWGPNAARIAGVPAALAGGLICFYEGTELEETCTPLWASAHPFLSPLFAATGISIGTAALSIVSEFIELSDRTRDRLGVLSIISLGLQMLFAKLVENAWNLPSAGSFQGSQTALDYRFGVLALGITFPLAARIRHAWSIKESSASVLAASIATLAGGFLLYNTALKAGNSSGASPEDYFEYTQPKKLRNTKSPSSGLGGFGTAAIGLSAIAVAGLAFTLWKWR